MAAFRCSSAIGCLYLHFVGPHCDSRLTVTHAICLRRRDEDVSIITEHMRKMPFQMLRIREEYLYQAVRKGFRDVRIIHGRGAGVQREIVHSILRRHPDMLNFRDASDHGATLVQLAKNSGTAT
jgi:Smr domain